MYMIDYKSSSGSGFVIPDTVDDFFTQLRTNYDSFTSYRNRVPVRMNNSNRLVTLINHIEDYFASDGDSTYYAIQERVANISRIFGLVTPGVTPSNLEIGLGTSVVCPAEHSDGQVLHCYHHDGTSLEPDYYLSSNPLLTVLSIDLPLLGKLLFAHKRELSLNGQGYNIDTFITDVLFVPVCKDLLNIAYSNRLVDSGFDYASLRSVPYMQIPLERYIERSKKDEQLMLSNFRGYAADIVESFPAPFRTGLPAADVEVEYGTNYQAFSMLVECLRFNRVVILNEQLKQKVDLSSIERQMRLFMSYTTRKRMSSMLPTEFNTAYSSYFDF